MLKVFKLPSRRRRTPDETGSDADASGTSKNGSSQQPSRDTSAPLLDLKLPSPSFGHDQANGSTSSLRETPSKASLWVDVSTPPPSSHSADPNHLSHAKDPNNNKPSLQRSATTTRRLKARLHTSDVAFLVEVCAGQLKSRGLEELGLFRPYRWAEDTSHQRRLQDLFLRSVQSELVAPSDQSNGDDHAHDLLDAARKPADVFAEELQYAGVHDIAAVIKWSLRHLRSAIAEPKSHEAGKPLTWLEQFKKSDDKQVYVNFAKGLSDAEFKLLTCLMDLVSAVAAYAEANAMSATRLCKMLGFWVLAPRHTEYANHQQFYDTWKESTDHFERIFFAYLRAQPSLTRRLQEILDRSSAPNRGVNTQSALQAVYAFPFDSKAEGSKEFSAHGKLRYRAKSCAALFNHALASTKSAETDASSEAITEEWWQILVSDAEATSEEHKYAKVLSEDSARIIALVDPPPVDASVSPPAPASPVPESPTRRRSLTVDSPSARMTRSQSAAPGIGFTNFPNQSAKALPRATSTNNMETVPTPSWSDFVSTGFKGDQQRESINLKLDPKTFEKPSSSSQAAKLHKSNSSASRRQQAEAAQPAAPAPAPAPAKPATKGSLRLVKLVDVEDAFADVYLDVLADSDIRAKWPNFAIAQLRTPLGAHRSEQNQVKWLIVEELEIKPAPPAPVNDTPSVIERAASPARSTASGREKKHFFSRISGVFSDRESRKAPPASPSKGKKKTSTPPPVLGAIPQSPNGGSESPQQAPAVPSPTKGLHISQRDSQSSLNSIKRVKPPSVEGLFSASAKTGTGEASSTTAVRHLSPGASTDHLDATETLHANGQSTPTAEVAPEVKEDAAVAMAAVAESRPPTMEEAEAPIAPIAKESVQSDEPAADTQNEEPTSSLHEALVPEASGIIDTADKVSDHQSAAEPHTPSLVEHEVKHPEVRPDSPRDDAQAVAQPTDELAPEVERSIVEEKSAVPAPVETQPVEEPSPPEPERPASEDRAPSPQAATTGAEPEKEGQKTSSSADPVLSEEPEATAAQPEASEPVVTPAAPTEPITQTESSPFAELEEKKSPPPNPQHLKVDEATVPRRSPSSESFTSQASQASSGSPTEEKKSKKLFKGAKKAMTSPFRRSKKRSNGDTEEAHSEQTSPVWSTHPQPESPKAETSMPTVSDNVAPVPAIESAPQPQVEETTQPDSHSTEQQSEFVPDTGKEVVEEAPQQPATQPDSVEDSPSSVETPSAPVETQLEKQEVSSPSGHFGAEEAGHVPEASPAPQPSTEAEPATEQSEASSGPAEPTEAPEPSQQVDDSSSSHSKAPSTVIEDQPKDISGAPQPQAPEAPDTTAAEISSAGSVHTPIGAERAAEEPADGQLPSTSQPIASPELDSTATSAFATPAATPGDLAAVQKEPELTAAEDK